MQTILVLKKEVLKKKELRENIIIYGRMSEGYWGETFKRGEMPQR